MKPSYNEATASLAETIEDADAAGKARVLRMSYKYSSDELRAANDVARNCVARVALLESLLEKPQ